MFPSGVFYKEHDDFEPWRGQWDKNNIPVYVLKDETTFLDELQPSPKLKIQELPKIQEHWSKVMEVIRERADEVQLAPSTDGPDSDPDPDGALLADDEPEPAPTPFQQKWQEGNKWWDTFFGDETKFWSEDRADATEWPTPLTENAAPYVQLPHLLQQLPLPRDRKQFGECILSAFDTLTADLPSSMEASIANKFGEVIKSSMDLCKEIGQEPNTLHLYSSEGTKPEQGTSYDATTDMEVGHMAVVKVVAEDSSGQRGWDLVRVKAIKEGQIECVYVMPKIRGLKYTEKECPAWPDNWMEYKMVPITVGKMRRKTVEWAGTLSHASVQFSFKPEGDKIPGKYFHSVQMACLAIGTSHTPDALESDADVPV